MLGDGTKLGTIPNRPQQALILDITRMIRRVGRAATGVDRVERAYFEHFLSRSCPVFFLCRTSLGFVLLDRDGGNALQRRLDGQVPWGAIDRTSRIFSRTTPEIKQAESDLRRLCTARTIPLGLAKMLRAHLPDRAAYYNVGHSNLGRLSLPAIKRAGVDINVLIHDVIPLEFPQFQRPGTVKTFRKRLLMAQRHATRLVFNSTDTRNRTEAILAQSGTVPPCVVAHLGVTLPKAAGASSLPRPDRPYFITLGTIEPRKAHGLLLDVWDAMTSDRGPENVPLLLICGARGWNNEAVFKRLDAMPAGAPVKELPDLDDATIADLLSGSLGLLFPSHAEGFGLPPIEAAALGCPVVCRDLSIYREILGNIPVYAESDDRYLWQSIVEHLEADDRATSARKNADEFVPPEWDDHFNAVLSSGE